MNKNSNKNNIRYILRLVIMAIAVIAGLVVCLDESIYTSNDYEDLHIYTIETTSPCPTISLEPYNSESPIQTQLPATQNPVVKPTATIIETVTPSFIPTKAPETVTTKFPITTKVPVVSQEPTIPSKEPVNTPSKAPTKSPIKTEEVIGTKIPVVTKEPEKTLDLTSSMKESTQKSVNNKVSVKSNLVTTYENMSYYFYTSQCDTAVVFYKEKGSDNWRLADTPVYSKEDKVYKGSICYLNEGKSYDVKIELYDNYNLIARQTAQIKTKNSNVKIAKTIKLSQYISDSEIYGLYLKNIKGTKDGYIRIIGDVNIASKGSGERYIMENGVGKGNLRTQSLDTLNYALLMHSCEYVILEGFNVKGGEEAAVTIYGNSNNIILRDFDISLFGPDLKQYKDNGVAYDKDDNPIVNIHGLKLMNCYDILFEKSIIHNPKTHSSNWNDRYDSSTHPKGSSAIYLMDVKGGIVIRHNELKGSKNAYFMDIIEGWKNESKEGGINSDSDIYGNTFMYANDDAIELDGGQENIRVYNNDFSNCLCGVSVSPNYSGPSYIFRNTFASMKDSKGKSSQCIKTVWNNEIKDAGYTFIYHNTFCTKGSILALYREYSYASHVVTANNIMYVYGTDFCINNYVNSNKHSYNNDLVYNSNSSKFLMHTEGMYEKEGIFENPKFVDAANRNYHLQYGSPAIDRGIVINNFSDGYTKAAPDLGRYEKK